MEKRRKRCALTILQPAKNSARWSVLRCSWVQLLGMVGQSSEVREPYLGSVDGEMTKLGSSSILGRRPSAGDNPSCPSRWEMASHLILISVTHGKEVHVYNTYQDFFDVSLTSTCFNNQFEIFGRTIIFQFPGIFVRVYSQNQPKIIVAASGSRTIKSSVNRMTPPCGNRRWACTWWPAYLSGSAILIFQKAVVLRRISLRNGIVSYSTKDSWNYTIFC